MKIVNAISSLITATVKGAVGIANIVKAAVVAPTIESVVTAVVTVGITAGIAFVAVKAAKFVCKVAKEYYDDVVAPESSTINEEFVKNNSNYDDMYDIHAGKRHHRSFKDIVADTFSNRHTRKEYEEEDKNLDDAINDIKNSRENKKSADKGDSTKENYESKKNNSRPRTRCGRFSYEDLDDIDDDFDFDEYKPKSKKKSNNDRENGVGRFA